MDLEKEEIDKIIKDIEELPDLDEEYWEYERETLKKIKNSKTNIDITISNDKENENFI